MNLEFIISIGIQILTAGIFIGGLIGSISVIKEKIEAIRENITRLEHKQDKHNCLIERMAIVEQSCKSAHHRIDGMNKEEK